MKFSYTLSKSPVAWASRPCFSDRKPAYNLAAPRGHLVMPVCLHAILSLISLLCISASPADPQGLKVAPKSFPSITLILVDQSTKLEKDLAAKLIRRPEIPASGAAMADLQIDLRIIQRWLLAQTAIAAMESDVQIACLLRAMQLAGVTGKLEEALTAVSVPFTRSQGEAAALIHKMSYDLPDLKGVGELDERCKRLGYALHNIASPTPVDARTIPLMRPEPLQPDLATGEISIPRDGPRTLAELSSEITRATISTSLRQQLLAMARTAMDAAVSTDPARQTDAAVLQQMLNGGVDLAKGLSATTALSADARDEIETQLAEGLALFGDPRTRIAGRQRVAKLNEYRIVMNRLARGRLSPELRKTLAPAFGYALIHPEQGRKILNAIDAFVGVCQHFEATPRRDNPVVNLRRPTEDAARQFEAARLAFITGINDPGSSLTMDALDGQIADITAAVELYAMLDGMQQTYETLNGYKPRPFGAIESRTLKAAVTATAAIKSPARTDALRYLSDLSKLAQLSKAVTQQSFSDIPPAVIKAYTGASLADFEAKCRLTFNELVTQVAGGTEMDKAKIARLRAVGDLCDSLRFASVAERALAAIPPLSRSIDWTLTVEQSQNLLVPFQQELSAAFAGFISDSPTAVEKFLKRRDAFLPLVALLNRDASYAGQCAKLPEGLKGDLARLMTPIEGQPFSTERYLSYAVTVASLLAVTDADAVQTATDFAMKRLSRDMEFAVRDLKSDDAGMPSKTVKGK